MFALCGSRRGLAEIVAGLEQDEDEESSTAEDEDDDEDEDDRGPEDAELSGLETSAVELSDEKANRRARAFEKNSFRNPKFWMRWKGLVAPEDKQERHVESDMGYLVFASNACDRFEGAISCPSLGWKHLKMKSRKATSLVARRVSNPEQRRRQRKN